MKVLEIDSVPYGSTCKIVLGIATVAQKRNIEVVTASGYSTHPLKEIPKNHYKIGGRMNKTLHLGASICTGIEGYGSVLATLKLIRFMNQNSFDIIHIHNLHGNYVNIPMLFSYIKKQRISVIWTMHDCWAMTGLCPHFTIARCNKWVVGCHDCSQYRTTFKGYFFDQSKFMWKRKKQWFNGIENLTIVSPSKWLAAVIKSSFLRNYDIRIINNGINLDVFRPIQSDFRAEHNCQDKIILLGVSASWGIKKGLDIFVKLAEILDNHYQIVLVGTNEYIDQELPPNIISIHRTQNQCELARIYSAADLFVNPTREDNFPTVNLEALACGTPVVSFAIGGSPECFDDTCGCTVPCDDVEVLIEKIKTICSNTGYSSENCVKYAQKYDMFARFDEYVSLYEELGERINAQRE